MVLMVLRMKKSASYIFLAILFVSLAIFIATPATAQVPQKAPATERIIWKRVPLEAAAQALSTREIDLYLFALRPKALQELAGKPGIKVYFAPSGLVDIGLNPAPVLLVNVPGVFNDKEALAERLGVHPLVIAYFEPQEDKTYVELCAKPLGGLPDDVEVVREAENVDINPFCFRDIRFNLNFVVDRDFIVKNVYAGYAIPKFALYGPDDPVYVELADVIAKYKFTYDPDRAKQAVQSVFEAIGAEMRDGTWYYNGKPVQVLGIIRVEDERLDIGRIFANELRNLGIQVQPLELTFGEAITKVYATDPFNFEWFFYTEGWGKGAIDKWDPGNLAFFGAAWLGWAPGWGVPDWWNYKNDTIDFYSMSTFLGRVNSKEQWIEYLRTGTDLAIQESIRIWIVAVLSGYATREDLQGVTVDLGAGLRSLFNFRAINIPGKDTLRVGHLWVWTARTVWNPLGGFDDVYSVDPMRATNDPGIWRHPFTGEVLPFRVSFDVETAGPEGKLDVPSDAIWWDAENDRWVYASELGRTQATSKVVFDYSRIVGSNWHHGQQITFADIIGYIAEILDIVYDPEKSQIEAAIAGPSRQIYDGFVAFRPLPEENKLEVYVNFWHFDPGYIADYAISGFNFLDNPFELIAAMDTLAFVEKLYALDETRARAENIPQLSLVIKEHVEDVRITLNDLKAQYDRYKGFFTLPDGTTLMSMEEWNRRIDAAISWIDRYGLAWISQGPFMLTSFDKDAQQLTLEAFRDPTYPMTVAESFFGIPETVSVLRVVSPLIAPGEPAKITVQVSGPEPLSVRFIIRDPATGEVVASDWATQTAPGVFTIELSAEITSKLAEFSAYELIVTAFSGQIALPDERVVILQTAAATRKIIQEEISGVEERISNVEERISGIEERISDIESSIENLRESLQQQFESRLEALREALGERVTTSIQELATGVSRSISDLSDTFTAGLRDVTEGLREVTGVTEELSNRIDAVSSRVEEVRSELASSIDKLSVAVEGKADKSDVQQLSDMITEVLTKAEEAGSTASTAMMVSIVNLVLLLVAIALLVMRRGGG